MPRKPTFKCRFCHSVVEAKGLCGTCSSFFKRHREQQACRCADCSGQGYSLAIPKLGHGETLTVTIRRGVEE